MLREGVEQSLAARPAAVPIEEGRAVCVLAAVAEVGPSDERGVLSVGCEQVEQPLSVARRIELAPQERGDDLGLGGGANDAHHVSGESRDDRAITML